MCRRAPVHPKFSTFVEILQFRARFVQPVVIWRQSAGQCFATTSARQAKQKATCHVLIEINIPSSDARIQMLFNFRCILVRVLET